MLVAAVKGLGFAESGEETVSRLWSSSIPAVASETLSAETSAQPPLQVPLSYANRSMLIFATLSRLMPGRFRPSSCHSLSV